MVTGDGDGLSIGGNHLLHILRRNVDVTILMFNNQIYGLTKGQYSPTSSLGKRTKSSPLGSIDYPLNPISFALASEATFVARTVDTMSSHLEQTLVDASRHRGVSFIEILQNCPIFNDGVWDRARDSKSRKDSTAQLVDGEPVVFGADNEKVLALSGREFKVANREEVAEEDLYIHRESDPSPTTDYLLSRLQFPEFPFILGKFRTWARPTYDSMLMDQIDEARATQDSELDNIFRSGDVWEVK
jgi:2-oxoglutarate ferredoxin oxidoreductase subunit beta